jgi:hypothetical protein
MEWKRGGLGTLRCCGGGLGVVELERRIFPGDGGGGVDREEVVRRVAVPCSRWKLLPN